MPPALLNVESKVAVPISRWENVVASTSSPMLPLARPSVSLQLGHARCPELPPSMLVTVVRGYPQRTRRRRGWARGGGGGKLCSGSEGGDELGELGETSVPSPAPHNLDRMRRWWEREEPGSGPR